MAEENQEEEGKIPAEIAENIAKFAAFLDPRLPDATKADIVRAPERWPIRRAAIFIIGLSLFLWGVIFATAYYAFHFLALRGGH